MDSKARRIFGIEFPKDAFMRYGGAFIFIMLSWHLDLGAQELDLDDLRWKNRVLLLVTGTGDTSFINEQSGLFSDLQLELQERKLLLIDVREDRYRILEASTELSHGDHWIINDNIYKRYAKDLAKNEVILIGLDGGVKLRQSKILKADTLFALIDGMPMRREEIRRRN